jgi:hypothetical protein
MSTLPALASRTLPASLYAANLPHDAKTSASTAARQVKAGDALSGSGSASSVSNSLEQHVAAVGNDTVDFAQSFLNSFAQSLFGAGGKDAQISFDSASLDTSSTVSAGVRQSGGPQGSSAAAFQLTDSSHFIGKGTITTADGRKFDFEVEVQYDAQLSASASRTGGSDRSSGSSLAASNTGSADSRLLDSLLPAATRNTPSERAASSTALTSSSAELPTVQLPNIDFPGTLSDLFKLIGLDLQSALSTGDTSPAKTSDGIDRNTLRSLSLRLLNLVNSKDTNTYSAPTAADKAKAAAASGADASATSAASTSSAEPNVSASSNISDASSSPAPASADPDQDGDSGARAAIADIDA